MLKRIKNGQQSAIDLKVGVIERSDLQDSTSVKVKRSSSARQATITPNSRSFWACMIAFE
jgi:hypothetical protein